MPVASKGLSGLPLVKRFKIECFVKHGIYEKDMRFIYIDLKQLQNVLDHNERVNLVYFNIPQSHSKEWEQSSKSILLFSKKLYMDLESFYVVRPYWKEFSGLIEAVEIEKFSIGLILQLVVMISIFNVVAFIIYLKEKKSKEIFLFQALGLSKKSFAKFWGFFVLVLWSSSCLISVGLSEVVNWLLGNLNILKVPGEIYVLNHLSLKLAVDDYLMVFLVALLWVGIVAGVTVWRLNKRSIIQGIRKEFA